MHNALSLELGPHHVLPVGARAERYQRRKRQEQQHGASAISDQRLHSFMDTVLPATSRPSAWVNLTVAIRRSTLALMASRRDCVRSFSASISSTLVARPF